MIVAGARLAVSLFSRVMTRKLDENAHKGGRARWRGLNPEMLLRLLKVEVMELEAEINAGVRDPQKIAREAADVANFALMIADACGGLAEEAREEARV